MGPHHNFSAVQSSIFPENFRPKGKPLTLYEAPIPVISEEDQLAISMNIRNVEGAILNFSTHNIVQANENVRRLVQSISLSLREKLGIEENSSTEFDLDSFANGYYLVERFSTKGTNSKLKDGFQENDLDHIVKILDMREDFRARCANVTDIIENNEANYGKYDDEAGLLVHDCGEIVMQDIPAVLEDKLKLEHGKKLEFHAALRFLQSSCNNPELAEYLQQAFQLFENKQSKDQRVQLGHAFDKLLSFLGCCEAIYETSARFNPGYPLVKEVLIGFDKVIDFIRPIRSALSPQQDQELLDWLEENMFAHLERMIERGAFQDLDKAYKKRKKSLKF